MMYTFTLFFLYELDMFNLFVGLFQFHSRPLAQILELFHSCGQHKQIFLVL